MATIGQICSQIIDSDRFASDVLLIREAKGEVGSDGIYVPGATETLALRATQQPANEDDRAELDVGERLRDARSVWVKTDDRNLLRPVRFGDKRSRGDILQIEGINYRVVNVDNYSAYGHIKAICVRIENQSD